ncbi:MAG: RsmD family RNA methyltransferase [Synergistaceae bacterium]|nr:RsmD family RNA methyltransferase [Synergistaceae bacterium]
MKDVRPTSGRVLSALFSILGDRVEGGMFLDLVAGTGRVGLEAMKRRAGWCVFVEGVKSRADEIRRKIDVMNNSDDIDSPATPANIILSLEVRRAVTWLVKRSMKFTVIFADPPYNSGWCETLPSIPGLDALFMPDTVMVIEHSAREPVTLTVNPHNLTVTSTREYGETCLTFLQML